MSASEKNKHDQSVSVPADAPLSVTLPNCVVLARAWMEAYMRAQETFDTHELDAFGYDAADLLGQVVVEYGALHARIASSPPPSVAPSERK